VNAHSPRPLKSRLAQSLHGQEVWYLLASFLSIIGIAIAAVAIPQELGLLALTLACVCFAIGILLHSRFIRES